MRLAGEGAAGAVERRRVALAELETERNEDVARVVALLTDRRLLTVSEGTIEFAHEALLREWPRLRGWIDEDRDGLRIQRSLSAGAAEWERLGRDDSALYRGARLAEVREWHAAQRPALNASERGFLDASEARRARERAQARRRLVLAFSGLATVLVAIAIVAIVAISNSREAKRQRDVAASRAIAARSVDFVDTDPRLSLALGLEAVKRQGTDEAQNALRQATLADRTRGVWKVSDTGQASDVTASPNGELLATAGEDGTVRIRRVRDGRMVRTIMAGGEALAVSFRPDSRQLAISNRNGEVALADVRTGERDVVLTRSAEGRVWSLQFSRDGRRLLVGANDGTVGILALRGERKLSILPGGGASRAVARFSHDETMIVAASLDGFAQIWPASGGPAATLSHGPAVLGAEFSPDDKRVATTDLAGVVRVEPAESRNAGSQDASRRGRTGLRELQLRRGPARDGRARRRRTRRERARRKRARRAEGRSGPAIDADFIRGHDVIVSVGEDGTLRRWAALPVSAVRVAKVPGRPSFRPDGKRVISGGEDGTVRVWNPANGTTSSSRPHDAPSEAVYSGDGRRILSGALITATPPPQGTIRLSPADGGTPQVVPFVANDALGLAIDGTGSRVALSTYDEPPVIERPDGSGRVQLRGHAAEVYGLAFSPTASTSSAPPRTGRRASGTRPPDGRSACCATTHPSSTPASAPTAPPRGHGRERRNRACLVGERRTCGRALRAYRRGQHRGLRPHRYTGGQRRNRRHGANLGRRRR